MTPVDAVQVVHRGLAHTRIRVLPAPDSAPPYDDEIARPRDTTWPSARSSTAIQGTLALAFTLPSGLPVVPEPPRRLRLTGPDLTRPASAEVGLPDPARWAALVVQAVMEVVSGDRPITQLVRWTSPEVYEQLSWRRRQRAAGPNRRPDAGSSPRRALVVSVHVCQPNDQVAEACATVRRDGRVTAIALRLEVERESWRCTALQLGV
jgi:hypothetical protein